MTTLLTGVLDNYRCFSGGANGADTQWDVIGREYGVPTVHFREPGQKRVDSKILRDLGVRATEISQDDYEEGLRMVEQAMMDMGRGNQVHPMTIRNWAQVKYSDAVYAIGYIVLKGAKTFKGFTAQSTQVDGGTGYAVQMGINVGKPVYVFCQHRTNWYEYLATNEGNFFRKMDLIPILTSRFAGIGGRELTDAGQKAIEDIYKMTTRFEHGALA